MIDYKINNFHTTKSINRGNLNKSIEKNVEPLDKMFNKKDTQ